MGKSRLYEHSHGKSEGSLKRLLLYLYVDKRGVRQKIKHHVQLLYSANQLSVSTPRPTRSRQQCAGGCPDSGTARINIEGQSWVEGVFSVHVGTMQPPPRKVSFIGKLFTNLLLKHSITMCDFFTV